MIYRILLLAIIIPQIAFGQMETVTQKKAFGFVDSFFQKGELKAEILDFEYPPELQAILLRFQKSMSDNREWFQEYISKNYKAGEGIPYHEKMGISKEDYQRIKDIEKESPRVVVIKTALVKVDNASGKVTFFNPDEELPEINLLEIDVINRQLFFNSDTIFFHHEINAPSTTLGEWRGFSWKREISNLDDDDELNADKLVARVTEIQLGRAKLDGKKIIIIKHKDVDKGRVNADTNIILLLK